MELALLYNIHLKQDFYLCLTQLSTNIFKDLIFHELDSFLTSSLMGSVSVYLHFCPLVVNKQICRSFLTIYLHFIGFMKE